MKTLTKSVIILTVIITFFSSYGSADTKMFELRTYIPSPFLNALKTSSVEAPKGGFTIKYFCLIAGTSRTYSPRPEQNAEP